MQKAKAAAKRSKKKPAAPKSEPKPNNKVGRVGRPTKYTAELGRHICERLADGVTLRAVCRDEGMPSDRRVRSWALDVEHPFAPQYARAPEIGYHRMVDEILEIADDSSGDFVEREGKDGEMYTAVDHDTINRARLRVDTRKWLLAKALPKIYGDKSEVHVTGQAQYPKSEPVSATLDWIESILGKEKNSAEANQPGQQRLNGRSENG